MLKLKVALLSLLIAGTSTLFAQTTQPAEKATPKLPPKEHAWWTISSLAIGPQKYKSLLQFYDGRPVKTAQDWQVRRQEIRDYWMKAMGDWPELIEKPKIEFISKEHVENFTRHKVKVQLLPDESLDMYLLIPDGDGPFPAVVTVFYTTESSSGLSKSPGAKGTYDYGLQLARAGYVTLNIGYRPVWAPKKGTKLQPLSLLAYIAANGYNAVASLPQVDPKRVGIIGHSYGGKWSMFGASLCDKYAAGCWSDPGIVFDETRPNVNYWEPWYLGYDASVDKQRTKGVLTPESPRTGPYKKLIEEGHDLTEIQALMAPRPFLVSGGSEDTAERWLPLSRISEVYDLLGAPNRVFLSLRNGHTPTPQANAQMLAFFDYYLK